MKIEWLTIDDAKSAVTIYDNNIRLSKKAADYFQDAYAIAIGVDRETKNIIIKNISKEEADSNAIEKASLHKISIKSSYGRITGKQMVDELKRIFHFDFNTCQTYKFGARWNTGDKMLIVETGGSSNE